LLSTIFKAIASALFGWIGGLIASWQQRRADKAEGVATQAAAETSRTATVEAQVAQAEADSPRTNAELDKRLSDGTF